MHFSKSFAALATVAFGASCAIPLPFSDAGSAPTLSVPNFPTSLFPTPSLGNLPTLSGEPSLPSIADSPLVPRADASSSAQNFMAAAEQFNHLAGQLKSMYSSGASASDINAVLVQVQVVVITVTDDVSAVTGQPPMHAPAVADEKGVLPPVSAVIEVAAAVAKLAADVIGAARVAAAESPLSPLAVPLGILHTALSVLSIEILPFAASIV